MNITVEKYYHEDGRVAVLVSPGWGAGWSSWNAEPRLTEFLLFDRRLVELVQAKAAEEAAKHLVQELGIDPMPYLGGWNDLEIVWVRPGTQFRIHEYDGNETLVRLDAETYHTA